MSFAEVQREKCPLFYLFCDDGRVQQAVIAFAEFEGVCSLEHRQKCVQGRLDSSWMLFQPFLGKMSFVPAVFKKKKTKVFLLQEGNLWWAKVNLNSLVVCCLYSLFV